MSTVSHALDEKEITNIFEYLNQFIIIPKNFGEKYDEIEKIKLAPKIDNKAMRNIMKKAGFPLGMLNDFCTIEQVSTEVEESTQKIITYAIVENVFKYIPLLNVKMVNLIIHDIRHISIAKTHIKRRRKYYARNFCGYHGKSNRNREKYS